jgi:hypothetical protein
VLCDLALCYLAANRPEDSIAAFERSVRADSGYAFDTMAANIADVCMKEPSDFAYALHAQLVSIASSRADFFLRCFNTRLRRKRQT